MMIRSLLTVFTIAFLTILSSPGNASHVLGGELSYRCVGNGRYVFKVVVYRDCTGIPMGNQDLIVKVDSLIGSISGACVSNNEISCSLVQPMPGINGLDISQFCSAVSTTSPGQVYCSGGPNGLASGMQGAISMFVFESCPVDFSGVQAPAVNAPYVFSVTNIPCCRNNNGNLSQCATMALRCKMFRYTENGNVLSPAQMCDKSPEFCGFPRAFITDTNSTYSLENLASDDDYDSLVYMLDVPLGMNGITCGFQPGLSSSNPFPGFRSLDPHNGNLNFTPRLSNKYVICVRVESWRCGQKIAEVYRDFQTIFISKPANFPANQQNPVIRPPFSDSSGMPHKSWKATFHEGDTVHFNIQATDLLPIGQEVSLYVKGQMFSNDYSPTGTCPPLMTSCASLGNFSPPINSGGRPIPVQQSDIILGYGNKGMGQTSFDVNWIVDKSLFAPYSCINSYTFRIYVAAMDDQCPFNGKTTRSIELTILPKKPYLHPPSMKSIKVNNSSEVNVSWEMDFDSTSVYPLDQTAAQSLQRRIGSFEKYYIHRGLNGSFVLLDSVMSASTFSYTDRRLALGDTSETYEYLLSTESGSYPKASLPSKKLGAIFLSATIDWNAQGHRLNWSRALNDDGNTVYDVLEEKPNTSPGVWNKIGSSRNNTYFINTSALLDSVNYRVEYADQDLLSISNETSNLASGNRVLYSSELEFELFPNPSKGAFSIRLPESPNLFEVHIRDSRGRMVEQLSLPGAANKEIGANLAPGTYFIEVQNDLGISIQKAVKL